MHVAVCRLKLRMPENGTIKDKRQVVHSLCSKVRNKFNVSIAEVDGHDLWQVSTIGISCVSNDSRHAQQVIDKVVEYIRELRLDAEVVDCQVETVSGF